MAQIISERQNHLVVCGWKKEMATLLREILGANPQWTAADLVVVAVVSEDRRRELSDDPQLKEATVIFEEAFHETALEKASVRTAAKVLVLADASQSKMSPAETDARTIMTIMTIERLAPRVYRIAEILDPAFSDNIKMAQVDEIVYPNEYSRFLLAGTMSSPGLAHTIYDLLTVDSPCVLTTIPIPDEFVGRPFGELFRHFDAAPESERRICVGLLENTGNIHSLRRRAKIEAQKSPRYSDMIQNLNQVKELSSNLPKLNPGDDYIIKMFSLAVVVQNEIVSKPVETAT